MPHQTLEAATAVEQNSVVGSGMPKDQAREQDRAVRSELPSAAGFPGRQQGRTRAGDRRVLRAGAAD